YAPIKIVSEPKIVDDIVSPLRKDGFASLVSDVAVIYQMGLPQSHLGVLKGLVNVKEPAKTEFTEVTIPKSAVKDSKITFETKPGEAIKLSTLLDLDIPKRIMISPYYNFDNTNDFPLAMAAKNMVPAEFARALTRGLSAKLVIEDKAYKINFDANSFRTNAANVIKLAQKGVDAGRIPTGMSVQYQGGSYSDYQEFQDAAQPAQSNTKPGLTAALTLLNEAIAKMNDSLLEQTFAYKGTSTRLNMSTFTSLQEFAISYLKAASATPASGQAGADVRRPQPSGRNTPNLAALINRVDRQSPGRVVITTDFRISLELNLVQPRQRPGTPVNADAANVMTIQVL
ncbi:MAG: hypothetical protein WCG75_11745, partial [Armatimonadota bacterium]